MQTIIAKQIYYNLNPNDKRVGDCYKRALALAFGKDYDVVKRELNKMVRDGEAFQNNAFSTLIKYIGRNGGTELPDGTYDDSSVDKFSDEHPTGTYLLFTNKDPNALFSNHVVAVINGDAYDSWDSAKSKIHHAYQISTESRSLHYDNVRDMLTPVGTELVELLEPYLQKLDQKYASGDGPIGSFELRRMEVYGKDSLICAIRCNLNSEHVSQYSKYRRYPFISYEITLKLDITQDAEGNTKRLWPKLKQKVYDWAYNINDELKESKRLEVLKYRPWDKAAYKAVPDELLPYVHSADKLGAYSDYNYQVTIKGYPKWDNDGSFIDFYADTISEMKKLLKLYIETGQRPGVDY